MADWISSVQFALLAGISQQRARKLCLEIENGDRLHWQGYTLEVRRINGRGGKSGVSYLINISSLPPYLQERLKALQSPVEGRSPPMTGSDAARERTWWLHVLGPALEHPKGSAERKQVIDAIAAAKHLDRHGRRISLTVRTLQRRLARMEGEGDAVRSGRADKGQKRVFISREWDKAVPFDRALKEKIAHDLKQEIRGLLKGNASWGFALELARNKLITLTRAEGFRPNDPALLERICTIPTALVSDELHYRKVHQFKRDRKAYEDSKPRVPRRLPDRPMELVVVDVHPVDVLLRRDDGSVATPRLIAFMDLATQRVWCELVFFEKRGGVRNVDMIEAMGAMFSHPAFGVPENLYIDNGAENLFAGYLDGAMQLTLPGFHGPTRSSRIIRALPYNASAKPIERWFGDFEQRYLSSLPGWIGGDRMKKKQEAVGRTVAPFGTFEEFVPVFYGLLRTYEHIRQGRDSGLKGRSPAEAFKSHVEKGWAATVMSPDEVRAACGKTETRKVTQGAISVHGRIWTCEELWRYPHDEVQVRVPAYHEAGELLLLDLDGERLGVALPDREYHPLDVRGAQATATRQKAHRQAIRALDRSAPDIPLAERLIALGETHEDVVPNLPAGTVTYDPANRPARATAPRSKEAREADARRREADEVLTLRLKLLDKKAG